MRALTPEPSGASRHNQALARSVDFNQPAAFGEFLRSARERRGFSLQQIAEETKIPQRHLVSLEHGDLSVIPGATYRRGEVVAYAKVVGLDPAVALAELERAQAPLAENAKPAMPSRSRRRHVGIGVLAMAAVLSALSLGLSVWKQGSTQSPKPPSPSLANHSAFSPRSAPTAQHQEATPSRASAEVTPASRPSTVLPHAAVDVATASSTSSTLAPATLQREQESPSQAPGKELLSAAVDPIGPISDESRLVIITEPAGARVTVDGIGWGTTPVTIRHLPAGTKQIRVTKDGYTAAVRVARVPEGRSVTLTIPLQSLGTAPTSR
jgi:cytoskeletal protein RodZ